MTDLASPPAARLRHPRWTDARLLVGLLLILVSIVVAARVVSAADNSARVWALTRDLPPGTELRTDDLREQRVRLYGRSARRYVRVGDRRPVGFLLSRAVGAGELLPRSALQDPAGAPPKRLVTVPVDESHALGGALERGDVVDIVATVRDAQRDSRTSPVLNGVTVVDVVRDSGGFGSGASEFAVVVSVSPEQALALTAAIQAAELDVIKVVPAGS